MAVHLQRRLVDAAGGYRGLVSHIEYGDDLGRAAADLAGIAPAIVQEAADIDDRLSDAAGVVGAIAIEVGLGDALVDHHRRHAFSVQAFRWAVQSYERAMASGRTPISRARIDVLMERAGDYPNTSRGRAMRLGHEASVAAWHGEYNRAVHLRSQATEAMAAAGLTAGLERRRLRSMSPVLPGR